VTRRHVVLSDTRRATHLSAIGKSGSGKSSLLKYLCLQDIENDRGFVYFDLHGDATPFLLRAIHAREQRLRRNLSDKLVVIAPADPEFSVGLNPLEQKSPDFVHIAEFAEVLKQRWHLDHFGARTDELLRNALYVLSTNGLTLLELAPFLTHGGFRANCLKRVPNTEIRQYFELRYNEASEAMRATMAEPILNKTSAFTADPHFRHIVGQQHSTFSVKEAMDNGHWIVINLEKGRLGGQAQTLASLIFTILKNAIFTREQRSLYTIYCDEIQNLVAFGTDIESVLSEARKFGVSVVSANQFLDQYPAEIRAVILSVGTQMFFQLSSVDAGFVAQALDGGKSLAERLKNLPQRHCIVKSGSDRPVEVLVPTVRDTVVNHSDLLNRSQHQHGRVRSEIENDIAKRQDIVRRSTNDLLHDWE
ncbi:MAG: type IV secretory system conjugative DNA transfer family protein, partial [Candidatus Acidiferrales bacterium]